MAAVRTPSTSRRRREGVSAESFDSEDTGPARHIPPKDESTVLKIAKAVRNNCLFGSLNNDEARDMTSLFEQRNFHAGETIIRQGEKGDFFYIIDAGTCQIYKDGQVVGSDYKQGQCFGELGAF